MLQLDARLGYYRASAIEVEEWEFLVVTGSFCTDERYGPLSSLLKRTQAALGVELAFVAQHIDGKLAPRALLPNAPETTAETIESDFARSLLASQPRHPAQHQSGAREPVAYRVSGDAVAYGTLVALQAKEDSIRSDGVLRTVARLLAEMLRSV